MPSSTGLHPEPCFSKKQGTVFYDNSRDQSREVPTIQKNETNYSYMLNFEQMDEIQTLFDEIKLNDGFIPPNMQ